MSQAATTTAPRLGIAEVKARLTIPDAWQRIGLRGEPGRICRSPLREDKHASFSVFNDGRSFKDFAQPAHFGDVIDFVRFALNLSAGDALAWCREQVGTTPPPVRRVLRPRVSAQLQVPDPKRPPTRPMPPDVARDWEAGVQWLGLDDAMHREIERWRAWPAGTVATLVALGLMGAPQLRRDHRSLAFPAQAPRRGGWIQIGFHARHKQTFSGGRPMWEYRPRGIPALPLVVGSLHAARLIVVTESQWDLFTFLAVAGWLEHERALPERVAGLAIRGASAWRVALDAWSRYWPRDASILVLPQADEAGDRWWRGDAQFCTHLATMSRRVLALPLAADAGVTKDFNDLIRLKPFRPADIRSLLVETKLVDREGRVL